MFFRRARAFCPAPSRYVLKESSGDGTEQAEDFIEEWSRSTTSEAFYNKPALLLLSNPDGRR